jgi:hypothetical protein
MKTFTAGSAPLALTLTLLVSCHAAETAKPRTAGDGELAGAGGSDETAGTSGAGDGGRGGAPHLDASAPQNGGASGSGSGGTGGGGTGGTTPVEQPDSGPSLTDGPATPAGPFDFGVVGQEPIVPLDHSFEPVPPPVTMDCPDDPTQGFTEHQDSFVVQRPYDLPAKDRFSYERGIYTAWVLPDDKSHATWSGTHSRTETRFSDLKNGEHLFSADFMVEPGSENVCIQQVKGALGPLGTYLRVNGGTLHQLGGETVASGIYGKWLNMKVAWDIATGTGRVWINNCLKTTVHGTKGSTWYFKFGTYTCNSAKCTAHFKNVHLYQKGSTDTYNVKSPIR